MSCSTWNFGMKGGRIPPSSSIVFFRTETGPTELFAELHMAHPKTMQFQSQVNDFLLWPPRQNAVEGEARASPPLRLQCFSWCLYFFSKTVSLMNFIPKAASFTNSKAYQFIVHTQKRVQKTSINFPWQSSDACFDDYQNLAAQISNHSEITSVENRKYI